MLPLSLMNLASLPTESDSMEFDPRLNVVLQKIERLLAGACCFPLLVTSLVEALLSPLYVSLCILYV